MKNPDVEVFVLQYHSRDVAVVGMVQKAGLYNITSRADSLLTMLNRAGGMTEHASSRMLFIPASPTAQYGPSRRRSQLNVKGRCQLDDSVAAYRHGPLLFQSAAICLSARPRRKPLAHGFHLAHPWAMNQRRGSSESV